MDSHTLMGAISPLSRGLFWLQWLKRKGHPTFPKSRRKRAPHGSRSEAEAHRELEKEIVQLRYAKSVLIAAIERGEDVGRSIGAPPWCVLGVRVVNANQKSRAPMADGHLAVSVARVPERGWQRWSRKLPLSLQLTSDHNASRTFR